MAKLMMPSCDDIVSTAAPIRDATTLCGAAAKKETGNTYIPTKTPDHDQSNIETGKHRDQGQAGDGQRRDQNSWALILGRVRDGRWHTGRHGG